MYLSDGMKERICLKDPLPRSDLASRSALAICQIVT